MVKAICSLFGWLAFATNFCLANEVRPSPGDVRTPDLWAGQVRVGVGSAVDQPCGSNLRMPSFDFPFLLDDRIRGRIGSVQVCLEVWMRGVTDQPQVENPSQVNVQAIYTINGKRFSKILRSDSQVGNNRLFVWELDEKLDPFLANSGLGGIMVGLLPESKTILWEDSDSVLASVPLDFYFVVNGHSLVSNRLGHFVIDYIGNARKTPVVNGPIPKILDVEASCQSGLLVGRTLNGFSVEIRDTMIANSLVKSLRTLNRFEGEVVSESTEQSTAVAMLFYIRNLPREDGKFYFQVGPMTSLVTVIFYQNVARLEIATGLLPGEQYIEWSNSFDDCKTYNHQN